jgi:hypothetical protein
MTHDELDQDLTPHFHWRWGEHGIYLGVCSVIGLFVLGLHVLPAPPKPHLDLSLVQVIPVRYIAAADEAPEPQDPFHDPRLVRLPSRRM